MRPIVSEHHQKNTRAGTNIELVKSGEEVLNWFKITAGHYRAITHDSIFADVIKGDYYLGYIPWTVDVTGTGGREFDDESDSMAGAKAKALDAINIVRGQEEVIHLAHNLMMSASALNGYLLTEPGWANQTASFIMGGTGLDISCLDTYKVTIEPISDDDVRQARTENKRRAYAWRSAHPQGHKQEWQNLPAKESA